MITKRLVQKLIIEAEYCESFIKQIVLISPYTITPIMYMHIDLGANTCIMNKKCVMRNLHSAHNNKGLCQIAGTYTKIDAFGETTLTFGNLTTKLHNVAYMPNNPHCTIGGGALTNIDQFRVVQHTMHKSVKFQDSSGNFYEYTKPDIKIMNGLDYIPVTLHDIPALPWIKRFYNILNSKKTAAMGTRTSNRSKTKPKKYDDFVCSQPQKRTYKKRN